MTTQKDQKHICSSTAQMKRSSELCANQVQGFIEYIRRVDPELKWHEAIRVTAAVVNALSSSFESDPEMMADLKVACQKLKAQRKSNSVVRRRRYRETPTSN